jgi:hypothetical protein
MEKMDQAPKSNPGVADVSKPKSKHYNLVVGKTKRDNPPSWLMFIGWLLVS